MSELKLTPSQENYLEAIYNLVKANNTARVIDISKQLGIGKSSVSEALKVLAEKKLINASPYSAITLTKEGEDIAKSVVLKHEVLCTFLTEILDIEHKEAAENACKIEHVISENVLQKLITFIEFNKQFYCKNTTVNDEFKNYCSSKE